MDFELGIQAAPDKFNRAHQLAEALQWEKLADQRYNYRVSSHHCIDGEEGQCWRTVDQDVSNSRIRGSEDLKCPGSQAYIKLAAELIQRERQLNEMAA